ncbi:MAG: radical SAM protein [Candidatus Thermoplasmatota archaeon]|nr:radical SAM protein [Candidatus Thermoplasmatota archaeon]
MYAYGPVPSRRLGHSIGVSPIPHKTCSYSCVYCQLGRTDHMGVVRKSFFPREMIMKDIEKVVENSSEKDYITFAGDGEPTLCADLGWLLEGCSERWDTPTAVITNSSLLWNDGVRGEVGRADVVLATLSAGSEETFKKIHRPHPSIKMEKVLEGLKIFGKEESSELWLEVMLVGGINDSSAELEKIAGIILEISPDRLHVTTPFRPPAEDFAKPPSPKNLLEAYEILGSAMFVEPASDREEGLFGSKEFADAREAILETCARHPLREEQARMLERDFNEDVLDSLLSEGVVGLEEYDGKRFVLPSHFKRKKDTKEEKR